MRNTLRTLMFTALPITCAVVACDDGTADTAAAVDLQELDSVRLYYSLSPDRANATPLGSASLRGHVYIFSTPTSGVSRVAFYLDDPNREGEPISEDSASPYDFAGTAADGSAIPFDVSKLAAGVHSLRAQVRGTDAQSRSATVRFNVTVGGSVPPPTPDGGTVSEPPIPNAPGSACSPSTTGPGGYLLPNLVGYANDCNTGPRYECTTTRGSLITSHDGQIIERTCINGSLEIRHNNVTVRDVLVMGTGTYAIDIGQGTATCPTNLRVEFTEVNMTNAGNTDWAIYQRCAGGHVFDHVKVMNAGRGIMTYGNLTINQSYVYSNRTNPGAHRTAFSTHGGSNFTVTGNTFICVNTGCSSSLNIYSDYAPASNALIQGNVLAGGSICLRGGETHAYASQTHDIRVLNNRFSTLYAPECGTLQAFAQFDEQAPGNVRSGNVWHESGLPITGE